MHANSGATSGQKISGTSIGGTTFYNMIFLVDLDLLFHNSPVADWLILQKVALVSIRCFIGVYGIQACLESESGWCDLVTLEDFFYSQIQNGRHGYTIFLITHTKGNM